MKVCSYGCGQEAKYYLRFKHTTNKWCCSKNYNACPVKRIHSGKSQKGKECSEQRKQKISKAQKGRTWEEIHGKEKSKILKYKKSMERKGKSYEELYGKEKAKALREERKIRISKIHKKYPFFSKIEEMRYNPCKPNEKEIQVHCKNHECNNSKEKGGWFTSTLIQIQERIRQLEDGNGGCYLYCSQKCKDECILYNVHSDPYKEKTEKTYTQEEYQTFREYVLERDNNTCQYCGKIADHVHHERPQKLEPFFALDPDLAWSVCKKCHYEKGHKDECNTWNLANKICNQEGI